MLPLVAALLCASAGACVTDAPGPQCPAVGVRHDMIGVVDGRRVLFVGWHGADGKRHYEPEENPELDRRMQRVTGNVENYGVDLPRPRQESVGQGPMIRTNDPDFGQRCNAETEALSIGQRPCPGPGPCPAPTPAPKPSPRLDDNTRATEARLAYALAAALGAAAFFLFLGAAVVGLAPRKA